MTEEEERPAVIQAHFVNFKPVPSRASVQLVFEVPSEVGQAALEVLGGLPSPAHHPWVAIARLNLPEIEASKERKESPMEEPSAEQQGKDAVIAAGIRAREEPFQRWILGDAFEAGDPKANAEAAAYAIRKKLGIASRTEIRTSVGVLQKWRDLVADYVAETGADR